MCDACASTLIFEIRYVQQVIATGIIHALNSSAINITQV